MVPLKFELRYLLAAAFMVVATVPVVLLNVWVEKSAFKKEIAAVSEKHVLLATNVTAALERYARDSGAAFDLFVKLARYPNPFAEFTELVGQLGFRNLYLINDAGLVLHQVNVAGPAVDRIPASLMTTLLREVRIEQRFGPVMSDPQGRPTIYLTRRIDADRIAVGALSTDYFIQLQKAITFGRKGHAAIVDRDGNLIAHPNSEWQRTLKNIAAVEPVRRMMAGETGVSVFYSPAMKQDMISGFTTATGPGWGVMVPQPLEELHERAHDVHLAALAVGVIGLAIAAVLSWFLAGLLMRPAHALLRSAREIAAGRLNTRVAPPSGPVLLEFHELATSFNVMANTIQENQQVMAEALHDARLADHAKSEFLANMSHELRTPLNAIIGFSDAAKMEIFGPLGHEGYEAYNRHINESGRHLLSIINDLLDLSKIEAGHMDVDDDIVEISRMLQSAVMLVGEHSKQTDIAVSLEPSAALLDLRGSEVKMTQILVNLLSNAVKFTVAPGAVTLSAECAEDGGVILQVADTGIGMSLEEIAVALEPFRQVEGQWNRKYEGTGLGLSLAKRLTELHDGTLTVESEVGEGTVVTVHIPANRVLSRAA